MRFWYLSLHEPSFLEKYNLEIIKDKELKTHPYYQAIEANEAILEGFTLLLIFVKK